MRVTFVYNPGAGAGTDGDDTERAIRAAGHEVRAISYKDPDWDSALDEPADLVAVSGGDGTIGRVAKRMRGRGVPIAALAHGTANNIAMTLGVEALTAQQQIDGWRGAHRFPIDIAVATGPWGIEPLIEGLGCGLLASSIRRADGDDVNMDSLPPDERLVRSLQILKERVSAFPTTHVHATLDGRDISGDYVLFEVLNMQFVGPNLNLAPQAHAGDGFLDVVRVAEADRAMLLERLSIWQRGAVMSTSPLSAERGSALQIAWTGFELHLDDRLWPDDDPIERVGSSPIELCIDHHAIEFLVP